VTSAVSEGGEQLLGVGKGIGEGVVGIGEGGLMLHRLSPANALIDRDSFNREWEGVQDAAEFAWNNPGEASSPPRRAPSWIDPGMRGLGRTVIHI
jgi:hypothetical protein